MGVVQTTVKHAENILYGAVMVEVAPFGTESYVDAGGVDGAKLTEKWKATDLETQNMEKETYLADQWVEAEFSQLEALSEAVRAIVRGNIDEVVNTAASSQVTNQDFAAATTVAGVLYPIVPENSDGSEPSIVVSEDSDDNGTYDQVYTEDTDYTVHKDENGKFFIEFISGGNYTAANPIRLAVTHTPVASRRVYTGGASTIPYFKLRLTNKDEDNKLVRWVIPKCQLQEGYEFAFKKFNEDDSRVFIPVKIKGFKDATQPVRRQLMYMDDEV